MAPNAVSRPLCNINTKMDSLLKAMVAVATLVMMLDVGVSRGQNNQDAQENNDFNHRNNMVVIGVADSSKGAPSQRPQIDEHQNERVASIDNLLEDAVIPGRMPVGADDQEDGGCGRGTYLTELDVCLTPEQLAHFEPINLPHQNAVSLKSSFGKVHRQKRQLHHLIFSLWTGGVVPYVFNSSFPQHDRRLVLSAMVEWERVTCIRFRLASPDDKDYIVFRDGKRCSTNIGRVGGQQLMTLAQPCRRKRILIHELGHVLGLIHEHQRQDRDSYVTVMLHNVKDSNQERYQFSKLAPSPLIDGQVPYSYTSIMHYGKNYFAKRSDLTTLLTADPAYQDIIGRADLPAVSDAEALNIMYGCGGTSHNRLPDATCDILKLKGECVGRNRDPIRSLCPRSCQTTNQAYASHATNSFQPIKSSQSQYQNSASKGVSPTWAPSVASSNTIGQSLGMRLADSLMSYQQSARTYTSQPVWPSVTPEAGRGRVSIFGNVPHQHTNVMYNVHQQHIAQQEQLRLQQQEQLRQEQLRQEQLQQEQLQQEQLRQEQLRQEQLRQEQLRQEQLLQEQLRLQQQQQQQQQQQEQLRQQQQQQQEQLRLQQQQEEQLRLQQQQEQLRLQQQQEQLRIQQQQEQLRLQQQQQQQPQFVHEVLSKWLPPSSQKEGNNNNHLPSWLRAVAPSPTPTTAHKVAVEPQGKAQQGTHQVGGVDMGGADMGVASETSMGAHNMNAFSPEALPEILSRLSPLDLVGGAMSQGHEPASYIQQQRLGLLESIIATHRQQQEQQQQQQQQLSSGPIMQGMNTGRDVYTHASGPSFAHGTHTQSFALGTSQSSAHSTGHSFAQGTFGSQQAQNHHSGWPQQQQQQVGSQGVPSHSPDAWFGQSGGGSDLSPFNDPANRTPRNFAAPTTYAHPMGSVGPDHSFFG